MPRIHAAPASSANHRLRLPSLGAFVRLLLTLGAAIRGLGGPLFAAALVLRGGRPRGRPLAGELGAIVQSVLLQLGLEQLE